MLAKFLRLRRPSSLLLPLAAAVPNCRHIAGGYLRTAFNAVDRERLVAVGPDRLCAEWILKNGGRVKLHDLRPPAGTLAQLEGGDGAAAVAGATAKAGTSGALIGSKASPCAGADGAFFTDYLHLPAFDAQRPIRVQELDATGTLVTGNGFAHLRGCAAIERILVVSCAHVTDDACRHMCEVRGSLRALTIENCPLITEPGLMRLAEVGGLRNLTIGCLRGVENLCATRERLRLCMPGDCQVIMVA